MRSSTTVSTGGEIPSGTFYLPYPVYRVLPLVYIVFGVLTPIYVSHVMAVISGILLVSAGVLTFLWRSAARSEARRRARARRSKGRQSSVNWH